MYVHAEIWGILWMNSSDNSMVSMGHGGLFLYLLLHFQAEKLAAGFEVRKRERKKALQNAIRQVTL